MGSWSGQHSLTADVLPVLTGSLWVPRPSGSMQTSETVRDPSARHDSPMKAMHNGIVVVYGSDI